jgi:hypothetical protein
MSSGPHSGQAPNRDITANANNALRTKITFRIFKIFRPKDKQKTMRHTRFSGRSPSWQLNSFRKYSDFYHIPTVARCQEIGQLVSIRNDRYQLQTQISPCWGRGWKLR